MYFQNKASHYQNIQSARHKVEDQLPGSLTIAMNTISHQKYDRDMPINRRY